MLPISIILRRLAKRTFWKLGYDIRRVKTVFPDGVQYETVRPEADYAPWLCDKAFQETYAAIRNNTKVDQYRCYELWQLVEQVTSLPGAVLEVGTWRGGTGAIISKRASLCGIDDPVYLADTFCGTVKTGQKDTHYTSDGLYGDASSQDVDNLCQSLGLDNYRILKGIFPDDTGDQVEASQIRFCHIDVDIYQSAKDILDWVWDRMPSGGLIVYDDYGFYAEDGITKHVDEQRNLPDRSIIHNLNGHAIIMKIR